ncbi:MarR family 2-MHQ and catechol resistance regulon transcriptional repressor [Geomicrobium halophilum]|uniref:MarR family 2-MHQ and catechol resistance regulon transcriptional repressor n=1 Tax=Geomicrobium halophilum TaxID=549000 RepID=A0A841Q2R4_9BACL|nr:MarR family transcriptional regulator [Geomicrobium halophilum]MBB6451218.1 MarR family 2-MHQ and catechol resistance regulon transcriptional repressor [Geomicrobium halophilum]
MEEKDQSLKLLVVMLKAEHAVSEAVQADMKRYGLNPSEFALLELLYHKGDQPIQQIGKRVLLTSGSLTYVVDKLEKKEMLERVRCTEDRRVVYASITEKGKEFMARVFPQHRDSVHEIFSQLSSEEKETMIQLLKRVGLPLDE